MPVQKPETTRHTEVERKFDVVESVVSPSFEGLQAVARVERPEPESLDAVYFDTADHDLARNKVTLRRRTGGADEGWHLKLPAGADARTEVRMPLDASDGTSVPSELLDVVLADASAARYIVTRLSDQVALVAPEQLDTLLARLRKLGHTPRVLEG